MEFLLDTCASAHTVTGTKFFTVHKVRARARVLLMFDNLDDVIQALAASNMSIANIFLHSHFLPFVAKILRLHQTLSIFIFSHDSCPLLLSQFLFIAFSVSVFSHCVKFVDVSHSLAHTCVRFVVVKSSMEFLRYLLCAVDFYYCCCEQRFVVIFPIQFIYIWVSFHLFLSLLVFFFFFFFLLEKWISSVMCMKVREWRSLNDILIAQTWATNDESCSK